MKKTDFSELETWQLEELAALSLDPLFRINPDDYSSLSADERAESLFALYQCWLESILFALEIVGDPYLDDESSDATSSPQDPSLKASTEPLGREYSATVALQMLRDLMVDLRIGDRNILTQRLDQSRGGRPKDPHRVANLKDQTGKLYNLLRKMGATKDQSVAAINTALMSSGLPIMTPDAIVKRAANNRRAPWPFVGPLDSFQGDDYSESAGVSICEICISNVARSAKFAARK